MKRILLVAALILTLAMGVASGQGAENASAPTLINFFNSGQYTVVKDMFPTEDAGMSEAFIYMRGFLEGWTALNDGDIPQADKLFGSLPQNQIASLDPKINDRCENIRRYLSARALEANGMLGDAIEAYASVQKDDQDVLVDDQQMIERFQKQSRVFNEISDIYADAQLRIGELRDQIYKKGQAAYVAYDYDGALELFNQVLDYSDSKEMVSYCQQGQQNYQRGLELYENGRIDEAIAAMRKVVGYKDGQMKEVVGYKDSQKLLQLWSRPARELEDLELAQASDTALKFQWGDSWSAYALDVQSTYYVWFAQAALIEGTSAVKVTDCSFTAEGLIPKTSYTIMVSLSEDGSGAVRMTAETEKAPAYPTLMCNRPAVSSFSTEEANAASLSMLLQCGFVEETNNTILVKGDALADEGTGYVLTADFVAPRLDVEKSIRLSLVLRVSSKEAYVETVNTVLPTNTDAYQVYADLKGMIENLYLQRGGWPSGIIYLEIYIDGQYLNNVSCKINEAI